VGPATGTTAGSFAPPAYDLADCYDEAFGPDGAPRPAYAELLAALAATDLSSLAEGMEDEMRVLGASFGVGRRFSPFHADPIPRIFDEVEWDLVERALAQRVQALQAFAADVYAECAIVEQGVVPARAIETSEYFEPWMLGVVLPPWTYMPIAGMDMVRDAGGRLWILEDNVRTPSGLAYALAAREAADAWLPLKPPAGREALDEAFDWIATALRLAAPKGDGDPSIVLVSDGPTNSAWYEHRMLSERLGIPLVMPGDVYTSRGRVRAYLDGQSREVQVVYRRTDEDRLSDEAGRPTWVAELLLDACRAGRTAVVNGPGGGIADDKLLHAYVDDMTRFYLEAEPVLPSVHTYDLGEPAAREEALSRVADLVLKPRAGHGGRGIVIGPHATGEDRALIARRVSARPDAWVAQETVMLSRLPTIQPDGLAPRHVDLRAVAISDGDEVHVVPGGLTRFARAPGALVVNSSQNGGGKDTWVLS
jgi:uncharacterized circularly permuted ATP-grasp superfamily protein